VTGLRPRFQHVLVKTGQLLHQPFADLGQGNESPFALSPVDDTFQLQFTKRLPDDRPADAVECAKILLTRDLIAGSQSFRSTFSFRISIS